MKFYEKYGRYFHHDEKDEVIEHNTPIDLLLKICLGKVYSAREDAISELMHRFPYLDTKDQQRIINAFLTSDSAELRSWVYFYLVDRLDDSLFPIIKNLWETYHEQECSRVVIRHFPLSYLKDQYKRLSVWNENRYPLAQRLVECPDFIVRRDDFKLEPLQNLNLLLKRNQMISDNEAEALLFGAVRDIARYPCFCLQEPDYWETDPCGNNCIFYGGWKDVGRVSLENFYPIGKLLSKLRKFGCQPVLDKFYDWDQKASEKIYQKIRKTSRVLGNLTPRGVDITIENIARYTYWTMLTDEQRHLPQVIHVDSPSKPFCWPQELDPADYLSKFLPIDCEKPGSGWCPPFWSESELDDKFPSTCPIECGIDECRGWNSPFWSESVTDAESPILSPDECVFYEYWGWHSPFWSESVMDAKSPSFWPEDCDSYECRGWNSPFWSGSEPDAKSPGLCPQDCGNQECRGWRPPLCSESEPDAESPRVSPEKSDKVLAELKQNPQVKLMIDKFGLDRVVEVQDLPPYEIN